MTTAIRNLLALAGILVLSISTGCQDPGVDPVDDDDSVSTPTECAIEADGAIDGAEVVVQKAPTYDFDGYLIEEEAHVFGVCVLEDGVCSVQAPAGPHLEVLGEGTNIVSCGVLATLDPSATTPHEITVPMGYGETAEHPYRVIDTSIRCWPISLPARRIASSITRVLAGMTTRRVCLSTVRPLSTCARMARSSSGQAELEATKSSGISSSTSVSSE